ncbi:DUF1176 domain-containing protein [Pseudomonas tructae]|uniref:DUF1176 domain-containing protein n=1 Tax=Pseudomonas tructae TaxID=2518644 RepID=A0A411MHU4_9PSED|nr:DUF1176 domain-containing protein [Pseudomonas tructae]QBF26361.1 DUF1176 domain-containing protein [Pseudomonas tructae]
MVDARWNWLALMLLPALALAEPEPVLKQFKQWVVGCDNTLRCTAVSRSVDQGMGLEFMREAGVEGAMALTLFTDDSVNLSAKLLVDGGPAPAGFRPASQGEMRYHAKGDVAVRLLRQLRNGQDLTLDTGDGQRQVSLQGLSAALLFIDSVQGRIDHPSAFVRPGTRPDSQVPPAPPTPTLAPFTPAPGLSEAEQKAIADAVIAITRLDWNEPGVDNWQAEAEVSPLDPTHVVVGLRYGCGSQGCMYSYYRALRTAPYQPTTLQISVPPYDILGGEMFGFFKFDPARGELTQWQPGGRYCGANATWRYDGKVMKLKAFRRMSWCDSVDTTHWPQVWRTQE